METSFKESNFSNLARKVTLPTCKFLIKLLNEIVAKGVQNIRPQRETQVNTREGTYRAPKNFSYFILFRNWSINKKQRTFTPIDQLTRCRRVDSKGFFKIPSFPNIIFTHENSVIKKFPMGIDKRLRRRLQPFNFLLRNQFPNIPPQIVSHYSEQDRR